MQLLGTCTSVTSPRSATSWGKQQISRFARALVLSFSCFGAGQGRYPFASRGAKPKSQVGGAEFGSGQLGQGEAEHRTTEAAVRKSEANEVETPHRVETGLEDVWHGMRVKPLAGSKAWCMEINLMLNMRVQADRWLGRNEVGQSEHRA